MRSTVNLLSRNAAACLLSLAATLFVGSAPAAAKDDPAHARALEAVKSAVQSTPAEVGLKVDESVLMKMSTEELEATLEMFPITLELEEKAVTKPTRGVSPLAAAAAPTRGCKDNTATLSFQGGLTKKWLWHFESSVNFCWNYGTRTVTSIETPTVEGNITKAGKLQGWKYRGTLNGPTNVARRDSFGISHYETYVQGNFELCSPWGDIACFAQSTPWIRLKSYRDGSTNASKGGV